jgi:hypothetical protein
MESSITASENVNSKITYFVYVDGDHGSMDSSQDTKWSDKSKDSFRSNSTLNSIMNEAVGFLSRASEGGRLIEANNGHIMYVPDVNEDESHKSDANDESQKSSNSTSKSSLGEIVGLLSRASEGGRTLETDNTHMMNVLGANEDKNHKSDSSDESEDSSKSNSTLSSIMNEAVGFLSWASLGRHLVKVDNEHIVHVRDVNERKSHKTDPSGEFKDSLSENTNLKSTLDEKDCFLSGASEEGHMIEADDRHIMTVRGANKDKSHKSDNSDRAEDSSKSNSTLKSIMNEAVGCLSRTLEEGRLIETDKGHIMYVQGVDAGSNKDKSHKSESSDRSKDSSKSNASLNSIMNEAVGFLSRTSNEGRLIEADDGSILYVGSVNNSLNNSLGR